jgi:hypothetical protein
MKRQEKAIQASEMPCKLFVPGITRGGTSLPLQLELIGTWTGNLPTLDVNAEGATSERLSDSTNTGINIRNADYYCFILITIEFDGDPSSLSDAGCGKFSMSSCSKYPTNGNLSVFNNLNLRGPHASMQDVAGISAMTSYGVLIENNTSNVVMTRRTWGGSCPVILGGNYTVNAYGIAAF